jgi:hypothetical protein
MLSGQEAGRPCSTVHALHGFPRRRSPVRAGGPAMNT